jgi:hypothetical protein
VQVDEAREGRKAELARLLLAGRSLLGEGDDELFEGLSPKVRFVCCGWEGEWE